MVSGLSWFDNWGLSWHQLAYIFLAVQWQPEEGSADQVQYGANKLCTQIDKSIWTLWCILSLNVMKRFTKKTSSMLLSKQIDHINMNIKPFCRGEIVQIGCLAREKLLWVKYNILSPHLLSNVYLMIKKSLIGLNLVWLEKCWVENWLKFSSINFPLASLHSHSIPTSSL